MFGRSTKWVSGGGRAYVEPLYSVCPPDAQKSVSHKSIPEVWNHSMNAKFGYYASRFLFNIIYCNHLVNPLLLIIVVMKSFGQIALCGNEIL